MSYRATCVIRAPVETASGYGEMSRDIVRHIIEYDKYDVKVHSINWGNTPMDQLDPKNPMDKMIIDRIVPEAFQEQPDLYISISIPTEFVPHGRYNIGITAGIETNLASVKWMEAMNRMDVNFVISEHAKNVFLSTKYGKRDNFGNDLGVLQLDKPIEVLHNCIDTKVYRKLAVHELTKSVRNNLDKLPEKYAFLFVGHWLKGDFGHDRKSIGILINIFYDIFKRASFIEKPALILKTSGGTYSIIDRERMLEKIRDIKQRIPLEPGESFPNVYLIHGHLTDLEMNSLYNHPKIKTHITLTKGEGFGRPLLEAAMSGKPIIAPGWSGHLDFLDKDTSLLIGGELQNVHPSTVWEDVILPEASWIYVNPNMAAQAMVETYQNYSHWYKMAREVVRDKRSRFSYEKIRKDTWDLLEKYVPTFQERPKKVELTLPKLIKKSDTPESISLPSLKKEELTVPEINLPKLTKKL